MHAWNVNEILFGKMGLSYTSYFALLCVAAVSGWLTHRIPMWQRQWEEHKRKERLARLR